MKKWILLVAGLAVMIFIFVGVYLWQENEDIQRPHYPAYDDTPIPSQDIVEATPTPPTAVPEPAVSDTRQIRPQFEVLHQQYNSDIIGHLIIEGTSIDYFVTQGQDNNFYLYHDIHRNPTNAGWVFLDHTNNIARPDRNTVIYAHNMRDGTRFNDITLFQCSEFFDQHRYITFNTLYEDQLWEIFAFYRTDITFPYIQVIFPFAQAFETLIAEMQSRSWHSTDIQLTADDRILTLSTCATQSGRDMRYVINARLVTQQGD
ncbi:MAG: class B sortase [Defluviitaleaceae bacterium]|nr:class B sortase [Defluviitaleaceae bacterium]